MHEGIRDTSAQDVLLEKNSRLGWLKWTIAAVLGLGLIFVLGSTLSIIFIVGPLFLNLNGHWSPNPNVGLNSSTRPASTTAYQSDFQFFGILGAKGDAGKGEL